MTLVKFNKRPELSVNTLLSEFFTDDPFFWKPANGTGLHVPPVNIYEQEGTYQLDLNVPGRKKEDFTINLSNGILTISFEAKAETDKETVKVLRREFGYKSFKRSFTIDEQIDAEKIEARYEDGILRLLLPKKVQVKEGVKMITVQ